MIFEMLDDSNGENIQIEADTLEEAEAYFDKYLYETHGIVE